MTGTMSRAVQELLSILDLEPLERNLYRGRSPQVGWQRVFGGQVIGQALVAATRTVEGRRPHSLHAYFLRPGDPSVPIIYEVDRIRDGRSFATRRVVAIQHGEAIFSMSASFQLAESGFEHQMAMPDVPPPGPLDDDGWAAMLPMLPAPIRAYLARERPVEFRPMSFGRYARPGGAGGPTGDTGDFRVWLRATSQLPDDPGIHEAILAHASDMTLLDASLIPHGRSVFEREIQAASLDHALWFHRPFRADDWLLYVQDTPSASGARGFSRGQIFDRQGRLVASVAQEGLVRERTTVAV